MKFIDSALDINNIEYKENNYINNFLFENHKKEISKIFDFFKSEEKFLYVYGFLGVGKRRVIEYVSEFFSKNVLKLEFFCETGSVNDDILLTFVNKIENEKPQYASNPEAQRLNLQSKLLQYLLMEETPYVIILHNFDNIQEKNSAAIAEMLAKITRYPHIKLVITTKGMKQEIIPNKKYDTKILIKSLSKDIFTKILNENNIDVTPTTIEDFYNYTRGYNYYLELTLKILNSHDLKLIDFLNKFHKSKREFDNYLGYTYINSIPEEIKNLFITLKSFRHGVSKELLVKYGLYDEFSINYLRNNLLIFENNNLYIVNEYFRNSFCEEISPIVETKLHKLLVKIYENLLKEPLSSRQLMISRQALRDEIDYHNSKINKLSPTNSNLKNINNETQSDITQQTKQEQNSNEIDKSIDLHIKNLYQKDASEKDIEESRKALAEIYTNKKDYHKAEHYYKLLEQYYLKNQNNKELYKNYYNMANLYCKMYKTEIATSICSQIIEKSEDNNIKIECYILLSDISYEANNINNAENLLEKARSMIKKDSDSNVLSKFYFKYALINDNLGEYKIAFEYYIKCIMTTNDNHYKSIALSNLASCYFENNNTSDAKDCFQKAYLIDKENNNLDGLYYNSIHLGKIFMAEKSEKALEYLKESKEIAKFLNDEEAIIEASTLLGDYYYDNIDTYSLALSEYYMAYNLLTKIEDSEEKNIDMISLKKRIQDMKLRMDKNEFEKIERNFNK